MRFISLVLIATAFATITSLTTQFKPFTYFQSPASAPTSPVALQTIASSHTYLHMLTEDLYISGDTNANGRLTIQEFRPVASRLFTYLYGTNITSALSDAYFTMADLTTNNKLLTRTEFSFFVASNIFFTISNIDILRNGDHGSLTGSLEAINNYFTDRSVVLPVMFADLDTDNSLKVSMDEFEKGFGMMNNKFGVSMNFPTETLSDFFNTADTNGDGLLSIQELDVLLHSVLGIVSSVFNVIIATL